MCSDDLKTKCGKTVINGNTLKNVEAPDVSDRSPEESNVSL